MDDFKRRLDEGLRDPLLQQYVPPPMTEQQRAALLNPQANIKAALRYLRGKYGRTKW